MSPAKPPANPVFSLAAIVFLALFAGSLVARFWADSTAARYTGPTHIAADDSQVLVFAADSLYQLTAEGELQRVVSLEQAGLPGYPIDLRLAGKVLRVASQRPAQVFACDTEAWSCLPEDFPHSPGPQRQFKLLRDSHGFSWLYTDARGDALMGQRPGESTASPLLPENTLAGPNDLLFDRDGHLWVADTDHRRIVEFLPGDGGELLEGRSHSAINEFTSKNNYYPMMMALGADGNFWLTQASEFSDGLADLVVYHPDEGATARIELTESQFATDIAALEDDILLTDLDTYRVYRVNTESRAVEPFGDAAFQAAMELLDSTRREYQRVSSTAMVLVVLFAVLMIFFAIKATPGKQRWTPTAKPADLTRPAGAPPEIKGIHWLERTRGFERWSTWWPRVMWGFTAIMLLGLAAAYVWIQPLLAEAVKTASVDYTTRLNLVFLLFGLLMLLNIPFLVQQARTWNIKLGSNGKTLHLRLADGQEVPVHMNEVSFSKQALLYRQYAIPIQYGRNKPAYTEGELETWVAPLLNGAAELSPLQSAKHLWKHQNPQLLVSVFSGVAWVVLIFLALRLLP